MGFVQTSLSDSMEIQCRICVLICSTYVKAQCLVVSSGKKDYPIQPQWWVKALDLCVTVRLWNNTLWTSSGFPRLSVSKALNSCMTRLNPTSVTSRFWRLKDNVVLFIMYAGFIPVLHLSEAGTLRMQKIGIQRVNFLLALLFTHFYLVK